MATPDPSATVASAVDLAGPRRRSPPSPQPRAARRERKASLSAAPRAHAMALFPYCQPFVKARSGRHGSPSDPTRPYPTLLQQQQHLLLHLKAGRQAGARLTHTQHPLRHHRPTLAREVLLLATSLANTGTFACSGARHHASVHPSVPPPYELAILDSIVLSWKATRSISLAIC